jgi:hypothetical protein
MRRALVVVAACVVVLWTCLVGGRAFVGRAHAGDDPLTTTMRKQIDASLIVFVGEATKLEPASAAGGESKQSVAYKVERYLKGTCFEKPIVVEHVGAALDAATVAPGGRVVVGVQLVPRDGATYALGCTREQLAPVAWTKQVEDAVAHYVSIAPSVAVAPGPPSKIELKQRQLRCMNNLAQLDQCWLIMAQENISKAQKYSGQALWLSMRKNQLMIQRGNERVLLCPSDSAAQSPKTDAEMKRWDDVDLSKSDQPAGLCSYAGRDFVNFPIDVASKEKEPIGACLHHPGGAIVAFEGGDVQFLTLAELGLASEDEKKVGPDSKSPLLRKLR